jgi:hypothetical protein
MSYRRPGWKIGLVMLGLACGGTGLVCRMLVGAEPPHSQAMRTAAEPLPPPASAAALRLTTVTLHTSGQADFEFQGEPSDGVVSVELNSDDVERARQTLEVYEHGSHPRKKLPFSVCVTKVDACPPCEACSGFCGILSQPFLTPSKVLDDLRGTSVTISYHVPLAPTKTVTTTQTTKPSSGATSSAPSSDSATKAPASGAASSSPSSGATATSSGASSSTPSSGAAATGSSSATVTTKQETTFAPTPPKDDSTKAPADSAGGGPPSDPILLNIADAPPLESSAKDPKAPPADTSVSGTVVSVTPCVNLRDHLPNADLLMLLNDDTKELSTISLYPGCYKIKFNDRQHNGADLDAQLAEALEALRLSRFSSISRMTISGLDVKSVDVNFSHLVPKPTFCYEFAEDSPASASPPPRQAEEPPDRMHWRFRFEPPWWVYAIHSFFPQGNAPTAASTTPPSTAAKPCASPPSDKFFSSPDVKLTIGSVRVFIQNPTPICWSEAAVSLKLDSAEPDEKREPIKMPAVKCGPRSSAFEVLNPSCAKSLLATSQALIWHSVFDMASTATHPAACYGLQNNSKSILPGGVVVIRDQHLGIVVSKPFSDISPTTTISTCHGPNRLELATPSPAPYACITITPGKSGGKGDSGTAGKAKKSAAAAKPASSQTAASKGKSATPKTPVAAVAKITKYTGLKLDSNGTVTYTPAAGETTFTYSLAKGIQDQKVWFVKDEADDLKSVASLQTLTPAPPPAPAAAPSLTGPTVKPKTAKKQQVTISQAGTETKQSVSLHGSDVTVLKQISDAISQKSATDSKKKGAASPKDAPSCAKDGESPPSDEAGSTTPSDSLVSAAIKIRLDIETELTEKIPGLQRQIGNLIEQESLYRANQQADDVSNFVANTEQNITMLRHQIAESYTHQAADWRDLDGLIHAASKPDSEEDDSETSDSDDSRAPEARPPATPAASTTASPPVPQPPQCTTSALQSDE